MKKLLFFLLVGAFTVLMASTLLTVRATQKNKSNITVDTPTMNTDHIIYVRKGSTTNWVTYQSDKLSLWDEYTVTTNFDSIGNYANSKGECFIKVLKCEDVQGTSRDTTIQYWVNAKKILFPVPQTFYGLSNATTKLVVQKGVNSDYLPILEGRSTILARIDSTNIVVRKQDSTWIKHGTHDTIFWKIQGVTYSDTIKR